MMSDFITPAFDLRNRPFKLDHLSASSMVSYTTCGLQWRLGHVDGIRLKKRSVATTLGTALHNGLRPFWKGQPATFLDQWRKIKDSDDIDFLEGNKLSWLDWYARGRKMEEAVIRALFGHFDPKLSRTEINYDLDLGFIKLVRRMDAYIEARTLPVLVGGSIEKVDGEILVDLKSAAQSYPKNAADISQQLMIYSIPGRKRLLKPTMAVYAVVTKSANPQVQLIGKRYDKDEIRAEVQTIRQVHDNIRAGVFIKTPGRHCSWCDFRHMCTHRKADWKERYVLPGH